MAAGSPSFHPFRVRIGHLLGFLIATRILLLVFAPHIDTSEARYAEMSRKMVETGDWITPQFDYGVAFWGKPPLAMWMSALGIDLFGANEFGSRVFIFLAAMGVLFLVADAARRELGGGSGWVAATVLMGMPLFYYCSGAVLTDLPLLLGTTLVMTCFRDAIRGGSRLRAYGFFVGLAIGMLAKGPLVLAISAPPIALWMLATRRWKSVWRSLPWVSGTLLLIVLAVPWYLVAEHKTPGFLDYFLVGEHWKRFTVRGWEGDLYGNAHPFAPGMIWIFLLAAALPWCLGLFAAPIRRWRELGPWVLRDDGRGLYWLSWAIWPMLFFTPARNIIATYPLPALPALALLLAVVARGRPLPVSEWRTFHPLHPALAGSCVLVVAVLTALSLLGQSGAPKHSERGLVQRYLHDRAAGDPLIYFGRRKYSAEFYSEGSVGNTTSTLVLGEKLDSPGRAWVAISDSWLATLPPSLRRRLQFVGSWGRGASLYVERSGIVPVESPEISHNLYSE